MTDEQTRLVLSEPTSIVSANLSAEQCMALRDWAYSYASACVRQEREQLEWRLTPTTAELTLMAGEMTAQELRTVRAVLGGIAARVGS